MKYIKIGDYLINLDKCISIYYKTSIYNYGEYVLYFELENKTLTSSYDDKEKLENDVALIEALIGKENLLILD